MADCAEEPFVAPLPAAGHALRQPRGRESGTESGAESRAESGGGEPGGGRRTAGAVGGPQWAQLGSFPVRPSQILIG